MQYSLFLSQNSLFLSQKGERYFTTKRSKWAIIILQQSKKGGCRLKIKEYRIIKGFTQHEMANLLNISQKTYSAKETGKRKFTIEEIKECFVFPNKPDVKT